MITAMHKPLAGLFVMALTMTLTLAPASSGMAAEPLRIGLIAPMSGVYAEHGEQMQNGVKLFLKQNGNRIAGRDVVIIYKDETGPAPDLVKRLAQELIVKDKVDFIAGFDFTPNAIAAAPVATQAKIPMIVMNASSAAIPSKSPYIVRTSFSIPQIAAPMARWASSNGIKKVYTLVADFSAGVDAENAFKEAFIAGGGTIVGEARVPLQNPEFAPFIQRVKDVKPDAVFLFEPPPGGIGFMKAVMERQLAKSGIRVLSTGDLVEENSLPAIGDAAIGIISSAHYSSWHNSELNNKFVADYQSQFGKEKRPNFYTVGAYDGMQLIARTLSKLNGDNNSDKFMEAVKGMQFDSPRGTVKIHPQTRDIIQTVYIRKTENPRGVLQNLEFFNTPDVGDTPK
jgi:branched-chain amino acid transport system substrate-binding protein